MRSVLDSYAFLMQSCAYASHNDTVAGMTNINGQHFNLFKVTLF